MAQVTLVINDGPSIGEIGVQVMAIPDIPTQDFMRTNAQRLALDIIRSFQAMQNSMAQVAEQKKILDVAANS